MNLVLFCFRLFSVWLFWSLLPFLFNSPISGTRPCCLSPARFLIFTPSEEGWLGSLVWNDCFLLGKSDLPHGWQIHLTCPGKFKVSLSAASWSEAELHPADLVDWLRCEYETSKQSFRSRYFELAGMGWWLLVFRAKSLQLQLSASLVWWAVLSLSLVQGCVQWCSGSWIPELVLLPLVCDMRSVKVSVGMF